jgi:hypothetical protein
MRAPPESGEEAQASPCRAFPAKPRPNKPVEQTGKKLTLFPSRSLLAFGIQGTGKTQRDSKRYDVYYVHHVMCSKKKTRQLHRRETTRL